MAQDQTAHLDPSELGTKEYWDTLYARELANHTDDADDEGTVWFDESNAEATVIRELDALASEGLLSKDSSTFLDLGTGNGHMLFALRYPDDDDGADDEETTTAWMGEMVGVDYSAASIDLARRIAVQRQASSAINGSDDPSLPPPPPPPIRFETWDLLTQPPSPSWLARPTTQRTDQATPLQQPQFDLVHDKGTFDAISLMPPPSPSDSPVHPCAIYRAKVTPLIREGGFLVITSCNWTRDELEAWLAPQGVRQQDGGEATEPERLELYREAAYPTFSFAGRKGQSVVTLVFRRVG